MKYSSLKKAMKRGINISKNYIKNEKKRAISQYISYYDNLEIQPKTILFETRAGASFTDNPYAFYKEIVNDNRFESYQFYWVYDSKENLKSLMSNLSTIKNTKFILKESNEYYRCLASVQYLINNSTFPSYFIKKDEQIYINTWHGTPLKTMGKDIPNQPYASQNVLRNFLMSDYLISQNSYTTNMFLDSYQLDGIYEGHILEGGAPRTDTLFNDEEIEILAKLSVSGIQIDFTKPVLLYMPTWRGKKINDPKLNIEQLIAEYNKLQDSLGKDYNILVKVHPYVSKCLDNQGVEIPMITDQYDADELLLITDILITDYSSIFFDYLITGKPIIFYQWDIELFSKERGMYFKPDELPGPIAYTIDEVVENVKNYSKPANYESIKLKAIQYDDGYVTKRYIEHIFFDNSVVYMPHINREKKKILLFPGLLKNNGITASAINLLNNIDYHIYDVTLFLSKQKNTSQMLQKINKNVRLLYSFGTRTYNLDETLKDKFMNRHASNELVRDNCPMLAYNREMKRLTGNVHFDVAIDFSGYSYFWTKFILAANASKYFVFQHNDLYEEYKSKSKHRRPLAGMFHMYQYYDAIVSVSETLRDRNRAKLSKYASEDKFIYCQNSLNLNPLDNVQQDESPQIPITFINNKNVYIHEEKEYKLLRDLNTQKEIYKYISYNDELVTIASANINAKTYYKLLLNHQYIGWIEGKDIYKHANELENEYSIDMYDTEYSVYINPGSKGLLYSSLEGAIDCEENNECYRLYWLNNLNLTEKRQARVIYEVDDEIKEEIYSCLAIDDTEIGWTSRSEIKEGYIEGENINHRLFMTKLKNMVTNSEYVRLNQSIEVLGYSDINKMIEEQTELYQLPNGTIELLGYLETENTKYLHILLEDARDLWVDDSLLKTYSSDHSGIRYKSVCVNKLWVKDKVRIFNSPEDYLRYLDNQSMANPIKYIENMEEPVEVIEEVYVQSTILNHVIMKETGEEFYTNQYNLSPKDQYIVDEFDEDIQSIDDNYINFVSIGRLSKEKNHQALIEAMNYLFEKDNSFKEKVRLYIIGDGAMKKELSLSIEKYSLQNNVFLLGYMDNPYEIALHCQCLVLPSLYEGQSMGLLEAMTLGMDIIATDIPMNRQVLEDGKYGMLINGTDAWSIEESIENYINYGLDKEEFDAKLYNISAMNEFYQLIQEA